jgi:hypothetical protein
MEGSSWSGWTTPPSPPARELGYPEGRKLTGAPPGRWASCATTPEATDDAIKFAALEECK